MAACLSNVEDGSGSQSIEQKNKDANNLVEQPSNIDENAEHIIVIGDTGVGKSSLIKLLTNHPGIKVSNTAKSCTRKIKCFPMCCKKFNKFVVYWDTIGTQDTNAETSDDKILNSIQRIIYNTHGNLVKFVWIVRSLNKATPNLQKQAQFIQKFQRKHHKMINNEDTISDEKQKESTNNKASNIWNSVLIIVSKPEPIKNLIDSAQGAIDAAKDYGCPSDVHWNENINIVGFTNLDWLNQGERPKSMQLYQIQKTDPTLKMHFYLNNEIKDMIINTLIPSKTSNNKNTMVSIIPSNIFFRNDYQCIKCGIISDPSFVDDIKCHTTKQFIHKTNLKRIHLGQISSFNKSVHSGTLQKIHPKPLIIHYHPGKVVDHHPGYLKNYVKPFEYIGDWSKKKNNMSGYVGGVMATALWMPVGLVNSSFQCTHCGHFRNEKGCKYGYDCCWNVVTHRGCMVYEQNKLRYECCGRLYNSEGCKQFYECCPEDDEEAPGCITECNKCRRNIKDQNGCSFLWECCNKYADNLEVAQNQHGCKEVCTKCHNAWGNSPGCLPNNVAKHDMRQIRLH